MTRTVGDPTITSETERNRGVIISLYRAVGRRDAEAIAALLDPDVVLIEADSLPAPGTHRGRDAFMKAAATMFEHLDVSEGTMDALLADGDSVVGLLRARWRRPDGTLVDIRISEHWRLRDGKVIECQPLYGDTFAMLTP